MIPYPASPHRTALPRSCFQTRTSSGKASRGSSSKIPPCTTQASSAARPSWTASLTTLVTTLFTDQVSLPPQPKHIDKRANVRFRLQILSFSSLVLVNNIMEVSLNTSRHVQALKGERLALNCTATTKLNTRVNITWDYPGKVGPAFSRAQTRGQK